MARRFFILLLVGLCLTGEASAQIPSVLPSDPLGSQPATTDGAFCNSLGIPCPTCPNIPYCAWGGAEVLLWQMRGMHTPPLITTSPTGTSPQDAGVLGANGTDILSGGSHMNGDLRVGTRLTLGAWLDDSACCGIEAEFFWLQTLGSGFNTSSAGSPILARPFQDVSTSPPTPSAELISYPGLVAGNAMVSASSTGLLGAGIYLRHRLCCTDCFRLDGLLGYRYLRLHDTLTVAENLTATDPNDANGVPFGTNVQVVDSFSTTNQFHGVDLGLLAEWQYHNWILTARPRVALGTNQETADILGTTSVNVPGFPPPLNYSGGFLALGSNSGHHAEGVFSVVPQLDLKVGYRITPRIIATVGYTFLDWVSVARAGDQIDPSVNPNLLPPVVQPVTGPLRPAFAFRQTDLVVNGVSFGLEFRY